MLPPSHPALLKGESAPQDGHTRPCEDTRGRTGSSPWPTGSPVPGPAWAPWPGRRTCAHSPLDAQRQHDAVMALQRLLTLVGGACVPHLQRPGPRGSPQGQPNAGGSRVGVGLEGVSPAGRPGLAEVGRRAHPRGKTPLTLMVLSEEPLKSRSPME